MRLGARYLSQMGRTRDVVDHGPRVEAKLLVHSFERDRLNVSGCLLHAARVICVESVRA